MTVTMNDLFDRYEEECLPELQPRSRRDYAGILVLLRKTFGHLAPKDVKPRQVVDFLNVPKGRVHRNRMVTILSTVFKKAIGKWCIEDDLRNPCTGVERWPTKPRKRYVTDQEFDEFRAMCCPQVQIAMDLALLTGQRQGDLVGLKWSQIKENPDRIEIDQGKTGKKLAIIVSPAVDKVLDRAWSGQKDGYVIQPAKGGRYSEDGFRAMWQRYCRKWERMGRPRFHFHDLRAKSISDSPSLNDAYLRAGHIDMAMTRGVYDRNRREVQPLR